MGCPYLQLWIQKTEDLSVFDFAMVDFACSLLIDPRSMHNQSVEAHAKTGLPKCPFVDGPRWLLQNQREKVTELASAALAKFLENQRQFPAIVAECRQWFNGGFFFSPKGRKLMDPGYCSFLSACVIFNSPFLDLSTVFYDLFMIFNIFGTTIFPTSCHTCGRAGPSPAAGSSAVSSAQWDSLVSLEILWAIRAEILTYFFSMILLRNNLGQTIFFPSFDLVSRWSAVISPWFHHHPAKSADDWAEFCTPASSSTPSAPRRWDGNL